MILASFDVEKSFWSSGLSQICGVDEVGRGCFAGPLVAGAVVFPKDFETDAKLADSKLLTAKKRQDLSLYIQEHAVYGVGEVSVEEINEFGITKSMQLAYKRAIEGLKVLPDYYLIDAYDLESVDGNKQKAIIKGDRLVASIAAASIVAKVYRDGRMQQLSSQYKGYGFDVNKGYGTLQHRLSIKQLGLCGLHRKSFKLGKFL